MNDVFEKFRYEDFIGVRELAVAASQAVSTLQLTDSRGSEPTERLVRYYLAEELIPEAVEKNGTSSVFNYQHLLSIVAIKKLQGQGFPLALIKHAISGKSIADLERLIEEDVHAKVVDDPCEIARFNAMSPAKLEEHFGEPVQKITDPEAIGQFVSAPAASGEESRKNAATEFLEGLLFSHTRTEDSDLGIQFSRGVSSAPQATQPSSWIRHGIEPGLEMNISSEYQTPKGYRDLKRVLAKIRAILRS